MSGIGGHQRPHKGDSDDWLTPPWIIERFGPFDTDPCACLGAPESHRCARITFNHLQNGLNQHWRGMVWLNPPYGPQVGRWLSRLAGYGRGIALVFARTDTIWFHEQVWPKADALLFLKGRLTFCRPNGVPASNDCGGPHVLIAYGSTASQRLCDAADPELGALVKLSPKGLAPALEGGGPLFGEAGP